MSQRSFREPNFLVKAVDRDGRMAEWLTLAESRESLRDRLQERGYTDIQINHYDFQAWKDSAALEKQKLIDAYASGQALIYDEGLWKKLKIHLFELFDGKCAYCDGTVRDVDHGQVEHYRPRNRVSEEPGHSGYYWLAYDLDNLLPTCPRCNGSSAKGTKFPVAGTRASGPEASLEDEDAQLLHPYVDDPEVHLEFPSGIWDEVQQREVYVGTVVGRPSKGETTVIVCRLNREELVEERKREQENFVRDVETACIRKRWDRYWALWAEAMTGRRTYAVAVLAQRELLTKMRHICPTKEEVQQYIDLHGEPS